jgi:hypothetical protein
VQLVRERRADRLGNNPRITPVRLIIPAIAGLEVGSAPRQPSLRRSGARRSASSASSISGRKVVIDPPCDRAAGGRSTGRWQLRQWVDRRFESSRPSAKPGSGCQEGLKCCDRDSVSVWRRWHIGKPLVARHIVPSGNRMAAETPGRPGRGPQPLGGSLTGSLGRAVREAHGRDLDEAWGPPDPDDRGETDTPRPGDPGTSAAPPVMEEPGRDGGRGLRTIEMHPGSPGWTWRGDRHAVVALGGAGTSRPRCDQGEA